MSEQGHTDKRCAQCAGPIQAKGRRDRKYCSPTCRTAAWSARAGKRPLAAHSSASGAEPRQASGLANGSAGLNDLSVQAIAQAVVAAIAELSGRQQPSLAMADVAAVLDGMPPNGSSTSPVQEQMQAMKRLQEEVMHLRDELAQMRQEQEECWSQCKAALEVESMAGRHAAHQRQQLAKDVTTLGEALTKLRAVAERTRNDVFDLRDWLYETRREQPSLDDVVAGLPPSQQQFLKRVLSEQSQTVQADVGRLGDPLLFLMRKKVIFQHELALLRRTSYLQGSARRLPDDRPETLEQSIQYAAQEARELFMEKQRQFKSGKARWLPDRSRLDEESELLLRREQEAVIEKIEDELATARRRKEEEEHEGRRR